MRPKSKNSNFELVVPSKGIPYFKKYGTDKKLSAIDSPDSSTPGKRNNSISAKKDLFVRTTTSFIAYWKTVYENAREIRYVVACLLKYLK